MRCAPALRRLSGEGPRTHRHPFHARNLGRYALHPHLALSKGSLARLKLNMHKLYFVASDQVPRQHAFRHQLRNWRSLIGAISTLPASFRKMWNDAWIAANFCRLCIRLNRRMARSRRRKGKCEFSALLFSHHLVTCFSKQPSSFSAALWDRSLSVTIIFGDPYRRIAFFMNFRAAFLLLCLVT